MGKSKQPPRLDEFSGLGSMVRSGAERVGSAALAALGSNTAAGRNDANHAAAELLARYQKYAGGSNQRPTVANVQSYLKGLYGDEVAAVAGGQTPTPPANAEEPPASAAPTAGGAATPAGQPTAPASWPTPPAATPGATQKGIQYTDWNAKTIKNMLDQEKPNARQVLKMAANTLAMGRKRGGGDLAHVSAYLKSLKTNPTALAKVPGLAKIQTETAHLTIDLALYLLEHRVTTEAGIRRAVAKVFLSEAPPNNGRRRKPVAPANAAPQPGTTQTPPAGPPPAGPPPAEAPPAGTPPGATPPPAAPSPAAPPPAATPPVATPENTILNRAQLAQIFRRVAEYMISQHTLTVSRTSASDAGQGHGPAQSYAPSGPTTRTPTPGEAQHTADRIYHSGGSSLDGVIANLARRDAATTYTGAVVAALLQKVRAQPAAAPPPQPQQPQQPQQPVKPTP